MPCATSISVARSTMQFGWGDRRLSSCMYATRYGVDTNDVEQFDPNDGVPFVSSANTLQPISMGDSSAHERQVARRRRQQQTTSFEEEKRGKGNNSYKHVPHRDKPVQLVERRNARERRRVEAVNDAFVRLRSYIPYDNKHKRLSKVKTLQIAIDYIHQLETLVATSCELTAMDTRCSAGKCGPLPAEVVCRPTEGDWTVWAAAGRGQPASRCARLPGAVTRHPPGHTADGTATHDASGRRKKMAMRPA